MTFMPNNLSRFLTRTVLPGLLPIAAIVVFALTDIPWLGYGLCLVTLVYFVALFGTAATGSGRTARGLIVTAVLLGTGAMQSTTLDLPLSLCGAVLLCVIGFEPLIFRSLRLGQLKTANLPMSRSGAARWATPQVAGGIEFALMVVYIVIAALRIPAWPLAGVLLVVALLLLGTVARAWIQRRSAAYQEDARVRSAVEAHAPRFALYFSGPASAQYQLLMWLPYFDRLGDPYIIILREGRNLETFAAATPAPLVVAPSIASMEHMLVPSIRAVFYANNSMKNTHCVRFGELTHIQLMHGDSEKPASRNPVSAMYDRVFVAGQAGVERYRRHGVNISDEQFRIVGRPQVETVEVSNTPIATISNPTVLYAPTWTGDSADVNFCSLPLGEKLVTELLERGATVLLREHPFTRRNAAAAKQLDRVQDMLAADAEKTGREHRWGAATSEGVTLSDCFNDSDAMIGDVSGVISDWLYSEKPFAITDMLDEGEAFTESFPLSKASYVLHRDGSNIPEVLDELLGTDSHADVRRQQKTFYLGDFPADSYTQGFLNGARECYTQPPTMGSSVVEAESAA
ncbi:MAG TPA: CDP-glycerol glycerophosphotransferase family protein [Stackebrandtia sp.]|jgi:hypothetical protein|uniref:CDP-glycerol glycerophosphotransferase family protein n=1 Tax=Stackebrandtia sp. TaxID=2023065 RepID=UPI002D74D077|nr:CDP-glycerol glycerophosphotransferase family protein [Stackebrandtia sp.]HZE37631.1 CDP-glycerol glycerophosphotransferase family protein [Stackebrandtia sp.]